MDSYLLLGDILYPLCLVRYTIFISVCSFLDPPSAPQLLGDLSPYRRKGDKVSLTCLASGGNPLPNLTWLRNGLPLRDSGKMKNINIVSSNKL